MNIVRSDAATGLHPNFNIGLTKLPTLKVQKITTGGVDGPFGFTATNLSAAIGPITTTTPNVAQPAAPASIDMIAANTAVQISETTIAPGWKQQSATCTDANSALTGNTNPVATATTGPASIPAAGVRYRSDITCVFTNVRLVAELSITKTNTPGLGASDQPNDVLQAGLPTTYQLVVRNAGPDGANGTIVSDTPQAGLVGCTVTCPPGSLTGGAACPPSPNGILISPGVAIPLLPANSSVTFLMQCMVP